MLWLHDSALLAENGAFFMWLHHFQPRTFLTAPPAKRVNPVCLELAEKWGVNGGGGGSGGCWVFVLLLHSDLPFKNVTS